MNEGLTLVATLVFGWRVCQAFLVALCLLMSPSIARGASTDSVSAQLHAYLQSDTSRGAGVLFGRLDTAASTPQIWTVGAIDTEDDLRLGCPTAKPCLTYIVLKEGIQLRWIIDRWFPEDSGFTKSRSITIRQLLLNSSGIRDYAQLVPMNPDSIVTPVSTIDRAYRHQTLLFEPGTDFEYSNTNFNIIGIILERQTGKTIAQLFQQHFGSVAPSLRPDDGNGKYPRGYLDPWPYHWSGPGYAGGFIGTASDAMRAFAYIAAQPEFKVMTKWYTPDGSVSKNATGNLLGLGLFGRSQFAGQGSAVVYEGNMGPCQMIIARVRGTVFYIASSCDTGPHRLNGLFQKLIALCF